MANSYIRAEKPTIYFIGVTTGKSSIMKVFPAWADYLGIDARIRGFDFQWHDDPSKYREAVDFIKNDPLSLGALVTTHKLDLLAACRDQFDQLDPYALQLHEVSSLSKRNGELWGHAKDPVSVGLAFEAFVEEGYWDQSPAEMLILGAGGSSLALVTYLVERFKTGRDVPSRIIVSNRTSPRLKELENHVNGMLGDSGHEKIHFEYCLSPHAEDNDLLAAGLSPGSLIVNATGLGKDGPGSPFTDNVIFPENGLVWEFNYRGELRFLKQAEAAAKEKNLKIEDGWIYFIHGWTRVIAEVFHLDIPVSGPEFDELAVIAARTGAPVQAAG